MNTGLYRDNSECYYTRKEIAQMCISYINDIDMYDIAVEPSAGTGVFLEFLPQAKTIAYDILPKHKLIQQGDYLQQTFDKTKKIIVVGNPPFGRQSSLAKKFIKKSCEFATTIAFILPKSFKKVSMNNCFNSLFHKDFEIELPKDSFIFDNKYYDVPCIFQIWNKKSYTREQIIKEIPNANYDFVKLPEDANLAFRRVGGNAGTFYDKDLSSLSIQTHYFIKSYKKYDIQKLNNIIFNTASDTVGSKSVSKQELVQILNKINFI